MGSLTDLVWQYHVGPTSCSSTAMGIVIHSTSFLNISGLYVPDTDATSRAQYRHRTSNAVIEALASGEGIFEWRILLGSRLVLYRPASSDSTYLRTNNWRTPSNALVSIAFDCHGTSRPSVPPPSLRGYPDVLSADTPVRLDSTFAIPGEYHGGHQLVAMDQRTIGWFRRTSVADHALKLRVAHCPSPNLCTESSYWEIIEVPRVEVARGTAYHLVLAQRSVGGFVAAWEVATTAYSLPSMFQFIICVDFSCQNSRLRAYESFERTIIRSVPGPRLSLYRGQLPVFLFGTDELNQFQLLRCKTLHCEKEDRAETILHTHGTTTCGPLDMAVHGEFVYVVYKNDGCEVL